MDDEVFRSIFEKIGAEGCFRIAYSNAGKAAAALEYLVS